MLINRASDLEQLDRLFAGQLQAGPGGLRVFPGGAEASDPLSWAAQARRLLGDRVKIFGFWCFENPQASVIGELRERHDFAVIDRRWVVDLWLRRFHSGEGRGIVDLRSPDEYEASRALYGDPESWERDLDMEKRMDLQAGLARDAAPAGLGTDPEGDAEFAS